MAAVGVVGIVAGVQSRGSGVLVELVRCEPQAPGTHIAKHCGWRGLRRSWCLERLAGGAPVAPPRRNPARSLAGAVALLAWGVNNLFREK